MTSPVRNGDYIWDGSKWIHSPEERKSHDSGREDDFPMSELDKAIHNEDELKTLIKRERRSNKTLLEHKKQADNRSLRRFKFATKAKEKHWLGVTTQQWEISPHLH